MADSVQASRRWPVLEADCPCGAGRCRGSERCGGAAVCIPDDCQRDRAHRESPKSIRRPGVNHVSLSLALRVRPARPGCRRARADHLVDMADGPPGCPVSGPSIGGGLFARSEGGRRPAKTFPLLFVAQSGQIKNPRFLSKMIGVRNLGEKEIVEIMSVLEEIFKWSQDRPPWQQDALRILLMANELSDDDLDDLTAICKGGHGLGEPIDVYPLTEEDIRAAGAEEAKVALDSITHNKGVNALAEDQTLTFSPGLTVVYGDNAAGKTGYIRILKTACRTRGRETILGNVVSGSAYDTPDFSIKYKIGEENEPRKWDEAAKDDPISRVSVFDTRSAAVYLTEEMDVAFRPFGLDLFDKLAKACDNIRSRLEDEKTKIDDDGLATLKGLIPAETSVAEFLAKLSSSTKPERVESLARLSFEELSRLALLEGSLREIKIDDPDNLARRLRVLLGRTGSLLGHLGKIEAVLSEDAVSAAIGVRAECRREADAVKRLREEAFLGGPLKGTGSKVWLGLWNSAEQFSKKHAYKGRDFPVVGDDARCVLCQQDISSDAVGRFERFQDFVSSSAQRGITNLRKKFAEIKQSFVGLEIRNAEVEKTLEELSIEYESVARIVTEALDNNEVRRKEVVAALSEKRDVSVDCPDLASVSTRLGAVVVQIEDRIKVADNSADQNEVARMEKECRELRARKTLAGHNQDVLAEIDRKKKVASYDSCISETDTRSITRKSTKLTRSTVTDELKQRFSDELKSLSFNNIEVEIREAGGEKGILYHKIVLTRAPDFELPDVVSEGEHRCLSIAAFFAETGFTGDLSGVVFDDPVSSFDYRWRERAAKRLVQKAKDRQVIIFTHDLSFCHSLERHSKELGVAKADRYVSQNPAIGAGVSTGDVSWVTLPVSKRIKFLRRELQDAEKMRRDGKQHLYEKNAGYIYGLLREAWERAVEEILLGGVVERYRPEIHTKKADGLLDIKPDDCKSLNSAMTECSKWLIGHDQPAAAREPVPEPSALKNEIDKLDDWVSGINRRREESRRRSRQS